MKKLFGAPLCWLRGVWYTIKTSNVHDFTPVSGHSLIESDAGLSCENCGKIVVRR